MNRPIGVSILSIILLLLNLIACSSNSAEETAVIEIELTGPVANPESEVSGLAWYKNYLVFLPQYPDPEEINPDNHPKLYAVAKEEISAYLENRENNNHPSPIEPQAIDFIIEKELYEKVRRIEGFEGFEAVAFWENKVFMTIEASNDHMLGYLVAGEVEMTPALKKITLKHPGGSESELVKIEPKPGINNMAYETLVVTGNEVIALYEANGKHIKTSPRACVYDHDLNFIKTLAFPDIEYRITDATTLDDSRRFRCINYYYPGEKDKLNPAKDPIAEKYGKGKTHNRCRTVERLVTFEYKSGGITLVNGPPLQLKLKGCDKNDARNWEGIVRLDNRGFLLVTDKRPWTIFGFVEIKKENKK